MGIYDRDYIRRDARGRGGVMDRAVGGMRMWSVTTWLIVMCAGVYILDPFLPMRFVSAERYVLAEGVDVNPTDLVPGELTGRTPGGTVLRQMLLTPNGPKVPVWREEYAMRFLESFLHFSTDRGFFRFEFWRLIGFQFLHASLPHLVFNMLGLFFFGPMVEEYLGRKRFLAFYLLCGIFGALMYLLLNLGGYIASTVFGMPEGIPGLLFNNPTMPLVGASAGVFGVLMAGAYLAPNATVLLFFFLPMRLATVAYALVAIAFLTVLTAGPNAGGEAGHIGGAIAGFYFIRRPRHLHGFFDILGYADPTSHHYRHDGARRPGASRSARARQLEIDQILDKINVEGIHSLTEYEKRLLREASETRG